MSTLGEPPELTVPMSVLGYVGWTILGLAALVALIAIAVLRTSASDRWVYFASAIPAILLCVSVVPYFRAAPPGWNAHHLILWAVVIFLGIVACALARFFISSMYGNESVIVVPGLFIAAAIALAKIWDVINENLASIPMSWGALGLLVVGGIMLAAHGANQR